MTRHTLSVTLAIVVIVPALQAGGVEQGHPSHGLQPPHPRLRSAADPPQPSSAPLTEAEAALPILVRPATLAAQIGELAGHRVRVPYARVVGVFNPRVFLIDTATRLHPLPGNRNRVVVLVEDGRLRVDPETIVASTVTVHGEARTLLGMKVSAEVAWPAELSPEAVKKLEIKAAVLARSVQSPEGVELTIPRP